MVSLKATGQDRVASSGGTMNPGNRVWMFAVIGSVPLFAGCGGGGSDESPAPQGQGSNPPPAPMPLNIFTSPTPGVYASLGSSTTSAGDGYTSIERNARLTDVSLESIYQPVLRYTTAGNYEIQLPSAASFDRLVHYGVPQDPELGNFFQPSRARQNSATFITGLSRLDGYRHSELASWTDAIDIVRSGSLAFGTPTPAAAIASSGSATYRGPAFGLVDITQADYLYGGWFFSGVSGTVTLTVDYAARTITGTLEVSADGASPSTVPLLATTILPGVDPTWWGSLETSESGFNEFKVMLTGPDASELIGSWAVPIRVNGEPHQLMGAWIAARD
jgi:hypothetical protein